MKNEEVAQAFKYGVGFGIDKIKTKHLSIENKVIYSYGYHFPIALKLDDGNILFTTEDYSRTTTRHKKLVKNCYNSSSVIYLAPEKLREAIQKGVKKLN